MLDEKDLQAIAEMIKGLKNEIKLSEERTNEAIHESEDRTRRHFNGVVENVVRKDISVVADGIKTLNDRLPNLDTIQDVQDRLSDVELQVHVNTKEIKKLKEA